MAADRVLDPQSDRQSSVGEAAARKKQARKIAFEVKYGLAQNAIVGGTAYKMETIESTEDQDKAYSLDQRQIHLRAKENAPSTRPNAVANKLWLVRSIHPHPLNELGGLPGSNSSSYSAGGVSRRRGIGATAVTGGIRSVRRRRRRSGRRSIDRERLGAVARRGIARSALACSSLSAIQSKPAPSKDWEIPAQQPQMMKR
ncbi:hypothetical protein C8R45DRAFT_1138245 [Mycena sanguinolenta]|nr:hypothetical protein C8R45DRAFT_1138245 [Mycena sanguinolenta]